MVLRTDLQPGESYKFAFDSPEGTRHEIIGRLVTILPEHVELMSLDGRLIVLTDRCVVSAVEEDGIAERTRTQKTLAKVLTDALSADVQDAS